MTESVLIPTQINNSGKLGDTTNTNQGCDAMRFHFTYAGFILAVLLLPVGFVVVSLGLWHQKFEIFVYSAHPLTGLAMTACVFKTFSSYVTLILLLWPLEWILYGLLIDFGISCRCSAKNVTADANPQDDGSLTDEQAELLNKLEELFRDLPPTRQQALLRTLRANSDRPATEKTPE
jgi:hypothetical protein